MTTSQITPAQKYADITHWNELVKLLKASQLQVAFSPPPLNIFKVAQACETHMNHFRPLPSVTYET